MCPIYGITYVVSDVYFFDWPFSGDEARILTYILPVSHSDLAEAFIFTAWDANFSDPAELSDTASNHHIFVAFINSVAFLGKTDKKVPFHNNVN